MQQRVAAVWRAVAGEQPVPAVLSRLQGPGCTAHVILSGESVLFGLSGLDPSALEQVAEAQDRVLAERLFQRLIADHRGVQWSLGIELRGGTMALHLSATTRTSTGAAADLAELREALGDALPWPDALPKSGPLTGWTVIFLPGGQYALDLEVPARSGWLSAGAARAMRDLPEVGAVRIAVGADGTLHYTSRTLIDEDDPDACWEAAMVPLAAYGRDDWARRLAELPGAVPTAIRMDGEDIILELKVS